MFKGSNVALITPFKNNLLDEEAYVKLIHFHIENGIILYKIPYPAYYL